MSKILECVSCGTCYESPPEFPVEGRKVRCAKCGEVWHAVAKDPDEDPPPDPDLGDEEDDIVFRNDEEEADESPIADESDEEISWDDAESEADDEPAEAAEAPEPEPETEAEEDEPVEAAPAEDEAEAVEDEPDDPVDETPEEGPELPDPVSVPPPAAPAKTSFMGRVARGMDGVTLGWTALVMFFAAAFFAAYEGRVAVVKAIPGTAWAYEKFGVPVNVRGLSFGPVAYHWAVEAGRPILEVEGEIRNLTNGALMVPTVVFALRNAVDIEVYQWAADIREDPLPGGERTLFLARIPSPPKSIGSVQVRFARSR